MAVVKVKVLEDFRDRTKDMELRKKDSVFEVEEERAKTLAGLSLVEIAKEEASTGNTKGGAEENTEAPTEESSAEEKVEKSEKGSKKK